MATTAPRSTQTRSGETFGYGMKDGAKINQGAIIVLEAGLAIAGKTAAGLVTVGLAKRSFDNASGADGAVKAEASLDCVLLDNLPADPVTAADVGVDCYLVDDETVAKTDGAGTRSRAGVVRGLEGGGVWVDLDGRK